MSAEIFQVHQLAAAKQRRQRRTAAPVLVVKVPDLTMKTARALAACPGQLQVQRDGTVLVNNRCRCCP